MWLPDPAASLPRQSYASTGCRPPSHQIGLCVSRFSKCSLRLALLLAPLTDARHQSVRALGESRQSPAETTLRIITGARDRAIAERRNIELTFVSPEHRAARTREHRRQRQHDRQDDRTRTDARQRAAVPGVSTGVPDTPDAFGNLECHHLAAPAPYMFASDGARRFRRAIRSTAPSSPAHQTRRKRREPSPSSERRLWSDPGRERAVHGRVITWRESICGGDQQGFTIRSHHRDGC